MTQCSLQKPEQYLHLNLVSCMRMRKCKWIELWTPNDGPHPSQQANSSCIVRIKSLRVMVIFSLHSNINTIGLLKQVWQSLRTGYLTSHFARRSVACLARPALSASRSECISMTTIFVHTALLFWPILSIQRAYLLCPTGNDMDYTIRKGSSEKYFSLCIIL